MNRKALPKPMESTSLSLLEQVKASDPDAWRRLAKLYGPEVYRWARQSSLQEADAADVVQEVFCAVARSIDQFRRENDGDSFRGWLWTVTRNKIRDHFRTVQRQPEAEGGSTAQYRIEQLSDDRPQSDDEVPSGSELTRRVLKLVRVEFTKTTWQAFWRVSVEGQRPADVSDDLGMSVAAVYMAKSRVTRRVREELDGLG